MIRRIVLLGLVCMIGSNAAFASDAESLSLTASNWPPYVADSLYRKGFVIAMVSDALERAGYETSVVVESSPRAVEATVSGDYDVYCGLWYTDDRAATLAFSEPFIDNKISFVKRSDSQIQFTNRADLLGLRIGVVDDYAYAAQPYDTSGIDVTEVDSVKTNIKRLLSGDIDLVLADTRVARYEIDNLVAAKSLSILPRPLITRGLRIAVSKKRADHREIVDAFEKAIAAMKADGTYNTILASYRVNY